MTRTFSPSALLLLLLTLAAPNVFAWGERGHEITALIAWQMMTPTTRQRVTQLFARDDSGLTATDLVAESTWADVYRDSDRDGARIRYRQTFRWHFVNLDLHKPDFDAACFGHVPLRGLASTGAEQDCIVDKIAQFERELRDRNTDAQERVRALQFIVHLIGDVHQPLHASNNNDEGGNRVHIIIGAKKRSSLHGYWDSEVVRRLGRDSDSVATALAQQIRREDIAQWQRGTARDWALEAWRLARDDVYGRLSMPFADATYRLDNDYQNRAKEIARMQLQRAGVRLAWTLNRAFDAPVNQRITK